jgi:glyoxylase-like metal-dependent hydrolase (beta-lactamase superfamily II)
LWNESEPLRTAHATTSLIRAPKRLIVVDPGLPGVALNARLRERTGISADQIDTVFLTNFRPAHRAGLSIFTAAQVLMHETEKAAAQADLSNLLQQAPPDDEDRQHIESELRLLESIESADDHLAPGVDLFPLFGYTPGTCGLIIVAPTTTLMIAGDAVPTQDHFLAGQVLPDAQDIAAAQESMREVYEIADLIVPGHDNLFLNPRAHGM